MVTEKEKEVLNISADLWNSCLTLPIQHKDDIPDIRFHIHAIQNIILGRSAQRVLEEENKVSVRTGFIKTDFT